jgi:hypothetical protein
LALGIERSTQPIIGRSYYRYGRSLSRPNYVVTRDSPRLFHFGVIHSNVLLVETAYECPVCEWG